MKNSIETLKRMLYENLVIGFLDVIDESERHANHAEMKGVEDTLTHVFIRIQAAELDEMSKVEQHRKIYSILQPAIDAGLHAIRIEVI